MSFDKGALLISSDSCFFLPALCFISFSLVPSLGVLVRHRPVVVFSVIILVVLLFFELVLSLVTGAVIYSMVRPIASNLVRMDKGKI